MLLTILNRTAKAISAASIVLALTSEKFLPIYLIIMGVGLVGYVVTDTLLYAPRPPKRGPFGELPESTDGSDKDLTDEEIVFQEFFSHIMAHCESLGINATIQNKVDGFWLVSVDDNTGSTEDIINLSMPDTKLKRENLKELIKKTCVDIDVKVNTLKNK